MPSKLATRIEKDSGVAGLFDALAHKLPASDLQSLLLEVYRDRSEVTREPALLEQSLRNPLLAPSTVNARQFAEFDCAAFDAASGFLPLDLSPACAFGASHALGGTSQNNVLTAIRNVEALGDPTIAMAFEAAHRRRLGSDTVRLCASHRVIRLQPFDVPGFSPHFRLFAMISAGRVAPSNGFEASELLEHCAAYLRLFRMLNEAGFSISDPLVEFTDLHQVESALAAAGVTHADVRESIRAHQPGGTERFLADRGITLAKDAQHSLLDTRVITPLRTEFPEVEFRVNLARLEGLGYYRGFALRISPRAPDGMRYPVGDGGFTDWTARLLGNRKERLLISGIGTEFLCKKYRT
ncbi:MAG TPA: hypothetical protein VGL53_00150 [Bryobacteraceae bacterium]|jgi:hypothetical protein